MPSAKLKSFFVHVPKCAGTSALSFLNFMYGTDRSLLAIGEDQGENALSTERFLAKNYGDFVGAYDFGVGHIPYTDIMRWSGGGAARDLALLTVLRDPLSRAISSYTYALRSPDHPDHAEMSAFTLNEVLEGFEEAGYANYICQYVAGTTDFDAAARVLARDYVAFPPVQALPAFLSLFQQRVGGELGDIAIRINTTPGGIDNMTPDAAVVRRFLNANAADAALVDWAAARWRNSLLDALDRRIGPESSTFSLRASDGRPADTAARDAPIYFLQTPGAAETEFRNWLSDYFGRSEVCMPLDPAELQTLGPLTLLRSRLIAGRLGWTGLEQLRSLGREPVVAAMFRAPADLSASLLTEAMEADEGAAALPGGTELKRAIAEEGAEAVLGSPLWADRFDDMQVRHLGFEGARALAAERPDEGTLRHALRRLKGLAFFGLAEELDWTAALFADRFCVPFRPMRRAAAGGDQISRAAVDRAAGLNRLDSVLYREARKLFDERVSALAAKFGTDPAHGPAALETALMRQFHAHSAASPLRQAVISQEDPLVCRGFQLPIKDPKTDWWIRWGGLENRLYLPLDRTAPREALLEFAYCLDQEIRDGLVFEVDGERVETVKTFREGAPGHWTTLHRLTVSPSPDAPAYSELTIRAPKTQTVVDGVGETTELAFALAEIRID